MHCNRVTLVGRLGRDPALGYTKVGNPVLNLRVATDEIVRRGDERRDHTEWHSVIVWGKRAEALSKMFSIGQEVRVVGRLQTRSWLSKHGCKRYSTEIVASEIVLLEAERPAAAQITEQPAQTSEEVGS